MGKSIGELEEMSAPWIKVLLLGCAAGRWDLYRAVEAQSVRYAGTLDGLRKVAMAEKK